MTFPVQHHYPLLCLTAISNAEVDGGKIQHCFINPYTVFSVNRAIGAHNALRWTWRRLLPWHWIKGKVPANKYVSCTLVVCVVGNGLINFLVEETPDEIITQRARMLSQGAEETALQHYVKTPVH